MLKIYSIEVYLYDRWVSIVSFTDRDDADKFVSKYNSLFEDEKYRVIEDNVYQSFQEAVSELRDVIDDNGNMVI